MTEILKLGTKMIVVEIEKKEDDIDWKLERREEARLDAMYDSYEDEDEGEE